MCYPQTRPSITAVLNGEYLEPYMYIRRIPLEQVPEDEKAAAEWLQKLYVEKDRLLDSFHETGSFFKQSGFKEVPLQVVKPRLCSLLNFAITAVLSISWISYYLVSSLFTANWCGFIITLSILGLCTYNYHHFRSLLLTCLSSSLSL